MDAIPTQPTVTGCLADFVTAHRKASLPESVQRMARRLLLNAVAASLAGAGHPAVGRLGAWATDAAPGGDARLLWSGDKTTGDRAALVNGALLEVLDFNETHIEAFVHPTAPVWPAVQATAELSGASLANGLTALAVGVEVELAVATMLMPAHYQRGFNPAVAAGAVGAAAGCATVLGLDAEQTACALGLAALGGAGPLEVLGTDVHSYRIGDAARSGFVATDLARRGFAAPLTAIDGQHGLLATVAASDTAHVASTLDSLGADWRICGPIAFKRYPTETISQAPLDCTLELLDRTTPERRLQIASMTFEVAPLVAEVNRSRRQRFPLPTDDQQARFDGSFCVAAAWHRGCFTVREMESAARADESILATRDSVSFVADPGRGMESATLEVEFSDGSREATSIDAFRGSVANPLSDADLLGKLAGCASGVIGPDQLEVIVAAIFARPDLAMADFTALLIR